MREAAATCGWLGYAPVAPGTFGTLGPAAIYALLEALRIRLEGPPLASTLILAALAAASIIFGVRLGNTAEELFGCKDPKQFVLDEAAGFFTTAFLVPVLFPEIALWKALLVVFATARFFDILKPPPIRRIEKLPGGWGIVLDDVAAGVYAAIASCFILWYISPRF